MKSGTIKLTTSHKMEMVDITRQLQETLNEANCGQGICFVFNPHTTAGLTINEGVDPAVCQDIIGAFREIVPLHYPYRHMEGNSPAHCMATMAGSSVSVFIESGNLILGTWQRIFFIEFDGPRSRKVLWKILEG